MELKEVKNASDYLSHFNQAFDKLNIHNYQEINKYYQKLCHEFMNIVYEEASFFDKLRQLLSIEAKVQILLLLMEYDVTSEMRIGEKDIIQMVEDDSQYFYRELTGLKRVSDISWSMIYLSER